MMLRNLREIKPGHTSKPDEVIYELEKEYFAPGGAHQLTRADIIDAIIQAEIECNAGGGDWYLAGILRNGMKGYTEMTDDELLQTCDNQPNLHAENSPYHELDIDLVLQMAQERQRVEEGQ